MTNQTAESLYRYASIYKIRLGKYSQQTPTLAKVPEKTPKVGRPSPSTIRKQNNHLAEVDIPVPDISYAPSTVSSLVYTSVKSGHSPWSYQVG